MAGAFGGHLLHTFNNASAQPSIVTSGAMSFDARAHGTPAPSMTPFSPSPAPFGFTPLPEGSTSAQQIAVLQAKLNKKLGPEYISQRPGPGGGPKLTYAEGWKIINLANEVFGFNGWSSSIVSITTDFIDYNDTSKRYDIGVTAILRVSLRDGAYHEDVGYGLMENVKSKAAALDKCKKEAITDALKRTLRNFGNLLGNCLYDKTYAQEVVKIKVPPARFDKNGLYRRPEFEERVPEAPASVPHAQSPEPSSSTREEPRVKVEHEGPGQHPDIPITYIPRHLRQDMAASPRAQSPTGCPTTPSNKAPTPNAHASTSGSGSGAIETPAQRCPSLADAPKPGGLATPVQTPMPPPRPPPPRPPPARAIATSPLARVQSAPGRSASSSDPTPAPARANPAGSSSDTKAPPGDEKNDEDEDLFPFSTQDGAMFAAVDLADSDLGRPIDYEEGLGGVTMMDNAMGASMLEPSSESAAQSPAAKPPSPQVQQRTPTSAAPKSSKPATGALSTSGHGNVSVQPSPGAGPTAGRGQQLTPSPQVQSGTSSARAQDSRDVRRVSMPMGRFNIPADAESATPQPQLQTRQQQKHVPKPMPAVNTLKRSADVMQAGSTRPPMQGLGLAQRQQQQQQVQQNTHVRPSNHHEGNDVKRIKR